MDIALFKFLWLGFTKITFFSFLFLNGVFQAKAVIFNRKYRHEQWLRFSALVWLLKYFARFGTIRKIVNPLNKISSTIKLIWLMFFSVAFVTVSNIFKLSPGLQSTREIDLISLFTVIFWEFWGWLQLCRNCFNGINKNWRYFWTSFSV